MYEFVIGAFDTKMKCYSLELTFLLIQIPELVLELRTFKVCVLLEKQDVHSLEEGPEQVLHSELHSIRLSVIDTNAQCRLYFTIILSCCDFRIKAIWALHYPR